MSWYYALVYLFISRIILWRHHARAQNDVRVAWRRTHWNKSKPRNNSNCLVLIVLSYPVRSWHVLVHISNNELVHPCRRCDILTSPVLYSALQWWCTLMGKWRLRSLLVYWHLIIVESPYGGSTSYLACFSSVFHGWDWWQTVLGSVSATVLYS